MVRNGVLGRIGDCRRHSALAASSRGHESPGREESSEITDSRGVRVSRDTTMLDSGEIQERLRELRARLGEFRGRL